MRRFGVDTKLVRFAVETRFIKLAVETKLVRFAVETRLRRFGVDTRLRRLGVEINGIIDDASSWGSIKLLIYLSSPAVVERRFGDESRLRRF